MKKFNFIKRKAFSWFEKHDPNKPSKSDNLSQPKSENVNLSPEDKKNNRNKLIKKLLILFLTLGLIALIVVPVVVSCTRQSEITLSNNLSIDTNPNGSEDGNVKFTDNDTKNSYVVNVLDNASFLTAYYRGLNNSFQIKLATTNSTLPIMMNVKVDISNIVEETNVNRYYIVSVWFGSISQPLVTKIYEYPQSSPSSTKDILVSKINGLTTTWESYPTSFNWLGLLSSFMPLILIIILFSIYYSIMKKSMGSGQDSIFGMGKSGIKATKTNVKFDDVAGIDEVKNELKELVDYVQNPTKYAAMGARAPKGIILYGPPGTGKTLIAKAVAGEANCNFFPTSGSSFEDMLVGVGAKRVRDLFTRARKAAPSIVFIDEIDSVASKRGKNDIVGGSGIADQTINQLLAELDGFTTDSGVVVIAATNRLDVLDEAILRPGRFDRQIQVTLPDIKGREEILKIHSRNKNISSEVDLLDIARRTPGFSGAQLENTLNEAAILAVRNNKITIKTNDIDEAIDRVIGGPARHGRVITEKEKRQIAYHEGGHALVGLHTENTEVVQKITIIPRGEAAGYTLQTPSEQERVIQTKEDLLNQVRMTLGGRAAEEIIYGPDQITTGAANDLYKVSQIIKAMVLSLGMSSKGLTQFIPSEGNVSPLQPKMFSETTSRELDLEIENLIQIEYKKAKEVIKKNRKELDLIVETLMTLETIVKPQIDYIHENLKLPPEVEKMKKEIKYSKAKAAGKKQSNEEQKEELETSKEDKVIDKSDKEDNTSIDKESIEPKNE